MVEIELDGQKVQVPEGSMVMHAAESVGVQIPHFCYHRKLSIAANCRMCLVDVEKAPKPLPACATPVTQGMIVRTHSERAVKAQKSVMEFLLINHPLDCPICDQGGECQLQDIAVGYGAASSRYAEDKRVVADKQVGPLISMAEMERCIHCTRCVRFGQEIAGDMELGMVNRGEHSEITTVKGETVDSELSGNMIDICPVGALTSKPFRYSARTWELSRRKSISPHDSTGANLQVQVKNHRVMRVLPLENEAVNECWIADRDRFSYEALNGEERLTQPMLKQGGQWREVDWQTALEYVATGLKNIQADHGAASIGMLASPHSTLEELHLAAKLMRGLGSDNIDHRLRQREFETSAAVRWLGMPIASLSTLQSALVIGSNLRKDHPLFAQRVRQAVRHGARVVSLYHHAHDWAMPAQHLLAAPQDWVRTLAQLAASVSQQANQPLSAELQSYASAFGAASAEVEAAAAQLLRGERKAVLLGNAAVQHPQAQALAGLANAIAQMTGATLGYLCEAANTVGAQWVGAQPQSGGKNAGAMLAGGMRALLLLNTEPEADSAARLPAQADMVVTLSPFKANMVFSDVLLPIAPFTETAGTFVNAEGRAQSFHGVVKPLGDTRPAWKVLRVLGNLLGLPGFTQDSAEAVLGEIQTEFGQIQGSSRLNNDSKLLPLNTGVESKKSFDNFATTNIYQLDSIVRRAPSLQATRDAQVGATGGAA